MNGTIQFGVVCYNLVDLLKTIRKILLMLFKIYNWFKVSVVYLKFSNGCVLVFR